MRSAPGSQLGAVYCAIVATLLGIGAAAPSPALTATPTPADTPIDTPTRPCGPTATPYWADHCVPCPTIRANCYADACGECHERVGPSPTPTPQMTETPTRACGPTATPYCADHCVPCPTIRANCYADACGECHENPVCGPNEICLGSGFGGCCTCVTPTLDAGLSPTPTSSPAPVAARCAGDCNGDGAITIDELVAAVTAALGTADAACPSVDRNADGDVQINDLIALVAGALEGCGLTNLASVGGVYDVAATQTSSTTAFDRTGLADVEHEGNRLVVSIIFDLLDSVTLTAEVPSDGGGLVFDGSGTEDGDIAFSVEGSGAFSAAGELIRLDAVIDFDSFVGEPSRITARITRPRSGTPSIYTGLHVLALEHTGYAASPPYSSRVEMQIDVSPSGRATCGAAQDVGADSTVLASLPEVECWLSPSGRFRYRAPYQNSDEPYPLPLQLLGELSAGSSESRPGMFYIASFPAVRERGSWVDLGTSNSRGQSDPETQPTRRLCPFQYGSRSSRLSTLPLGLRGSASMKSTERGHL